MSAPYDRATLAAALVDAIESNISGDITGDILQGILLDFLDSFWNLVDETPIEAGNALVAMQTFISSGTYTPTTGARKALMFVTGGGGGGGPVSGGRRGGSGGSGGTAIALVDLASVTTETVTIGAGGLASGTGTSTGGTTSIGSHASAAGGTGGVSGNANGALGGTGGAATAGGILLSGHPGKPSLDSSTFDITGMSTTVAVVPGAPSFWGGGFGRGGDTAASGANGFAMILEFG